MFIDSNSLADRDMEARISALKPILDELLDAATELPDHNELNELISQVHLTHRRFSKDVLQAIPVKDADPISTTHSCGRKPLYSLPKTDMPTFEGDPKLWRKFWEWFSQRLSMHPDLPAAEKITQLEQAIKPLDGRALISAPKGVKEEYVASVKAFKQHYDQPRKIYCTYVHELFEHQTPYTSRGLYTLGTILQDSMNGLELYGGMDAGAVMVAVAEKGLAKKAMSEWTAHLAKSKLEPTMTVFQEFITQKADELDEDDTFSKSSAPPKHNTPVSSRPYNSGRRTPRNPVLLRQGDLIMM